jgi:hypothetical protein
VSNLKRGCLVQDGDYIQVQVLRSDVCQVDIQDSIEGALCSVQLDAANVRGLRDDLADWLEQHHGR